MLVLALDTATPQVTAAVVQVSAPHEAIAALSAGRPAPDPVQLLAQESVTDAFAHAELLMPLATAAVTAAGTALARLDAVVVGIGPGPFTGLRVGMATAVALGDGLDIPVHGVPSHDGWAAAAGPQPADFLVVTDARRREVYLSGYGRSGRRILDATVVAPAAAADLLAQQDFRPAAAFGPGVALLAGHVAITDAGLPAGLGRGLVLRAVPALLTGAVPGPLTPLYLRRPDAVEPAAAKSVLA